MGSGDISRVTIERMGVVVWGLVNCDISRVIIEGMGVIGNFSNSYFVISCVGLEKLKIWGNWEKNDQYTIKSKAMH